jgi:porin
MRMRSRLSRRWPRALALGLLLSWTAASSAQEETAGENESPDPQAPATKSGLQVPGFGGPNSVSGELEETDRLPEYRFRMLQRLLQPWFDWKRKLNDDHGLSLGFNATVLGQYGDDPRGDRNQAFGGIYRFQGAWNAIGRGSGSPGTLNFRFEYRRRIGPLGPSALSGDLGVAAPNTGFAYSDDFGPDLSVLNWTQMLANQRLGIVAGRLDFAAYLDPYPYQSFAKGFLNRAFILNPSTATPGVGALGLGAKGFVTDRFWLGAMTYDANAVSGEFDWGTLDTSELFTHVEAGWTPSYEKRKTDKVLLTYWQMDERVEAGKGPGSGWLLTAHTKIADRYVPFLRAGSSDGGGGAVAEDAVSIGVGISRRYDEISLGLGWSRPSEKTFGPDLRDEYAFEASYRIQMSPNSTIMPDLQWIKDPAQNPARSSVWVASLRVRWDL